MKGCFAPGPVEPNKSLGRLAVSEESPLSSPDGRWIDTLWSLHAASALAECVGKVLARRSVFHLALAGGSTPAMLYRILARDYRKIIPQYEAIYERLVAAG